MSDNLDQSVIVYKIDLLKKSQESTTTKVDELGDRLLNPDTGLFTKMKNVEQKANDNAEKVSELHDDVRQLVKVCARHEERTTDLKRWAEEHERRNDELRETVKTLAETMKPISSDFIIRQNMKKWTDKIIWLILAAVIAGLLPTIRYMLFQAPLEKEKVQNLENILIEDRHERRLRQIKSSNKSTESENQQGK